MNMWRLISGLLLFGSILAGTASSASAEVPGQPFTSTECENYSDSVARLYTAGLGREPEQGGFDFWITEYTLGTWTFPAMANFFVNSPEFQQSYGTLNQNEFILQLYRNILGREGESGGVTFWNQQMSAGTDRATVLMRFAESPENIQRSGTVEPELGPFNGGRAPGAWRCGPSLTSSLFTIDDFAPEWSELPASFRPQGSGCDASLDMPADSDYVIFTRALGTGPQVEQTSYIAPTPHGAERYMAQVRQALVDCGSYTSDGFEITMIEVSTTQFGDDTIAVRLNAFEPATGETVTGERIVVRDGVVATAVQHVIVGTVDSNETDRLVALAAQRLAALNIGG